MSGLLSVVATSCRSNSVPQAGQLSPGIQFGGGLRATCTAVQEQHHAAGCSAAPPELCCIGSAHGGGSVSLGRVDTWLLASPHKGTG